MIDLIRQLSPDEQRELIALLAPSRRLDQLSDDDLLRSLVDVLRDALGVPDDGDLPLWLRRRLTYVATSFRAVEDTSLRTDLELARAIAEFALRGADEVDRSDELREHFNKFFRTKSKDERNAFLSQLSQLAAVRVGDQTQDAESRGGAAVADALLSGLSSASARPPRRARTSKQLAAEAPTVAAVLSTATAAGMTAGVAGAAMAAPLSVMAGGLYMARLGLKKQKLERMDDQETRASRARNSKLVQNVAALSVFLVASADSRYVS